MTPAEKRAVENKIRRFYRAATGKRLPLLMDLEDLLSCVDDIFSEVGTLREETLLMLDK